MRVVRSGQGRWWGALVFLVAWLAGVAAISLSALTWAPIWAGLWGLFTYLVAKRVFAWNAAPKRWYRRMLLDLLAAVAILWCSWSLIWILRAITWNGIGIDGDVGTPPCLATELSTQNASSDQVATIRRVECRGDRDGIVGMFVFVHKAKIPNAAENLVFRYTPTADRTKTNPTITWLSGSRLAIAVGSGVILQVTKQLGSIDGVTIEYSLGGAVCPAALDWMHRAFGPACNG